MFKPGCSLAIYPTFLFDFNYDCKLLGLSEYLPASFYKDFISYWQKIAANSPKSNVEVLNQIIYNNRLLNVEKN